MKLFCTILALALPLACLRGANQDLDAWAMSTIMSQSPASLADPVRNYDGQIIDFRAWFAALSNAMPKRAMRPLPQPPALATNLSVISGKILQVLPDGVLVDRGQYASIVRLDNYRALGRVFDGASVYCLAKESGTYHYQNVRSAASTVQRYDFGIPLNADAIHRRDQLVGDQQAALALERRRVDAQRAQENLPRIIAYQHQQASNGYPSFQLELGKRYLRGDGVPTNIVLAAHWLHSACTNHSSEASNLLSTLQK